MQRVTLMTKRRDKTDPGREKRIAKMALSPGFNAARAVQLQHHSFPFRGEFGKTGVPLREIAEELKHQIERIENGDLGRAEAMLVAQAHTLDALFTRLLLRMDTGFNNAASLQIYANLAFRAQEQCRKTLLALAQIQNPEGTVFFKQVNTAVNQQVNNQAGDLRRNAKNPSTVANELLSKDSHAPLDTRSPHAAGPIDPELETVGALDRRHHGNR